MEPLTLTDEQCRAIAACRELPLRLIDPTSHRAYVLIPAAEYERLQNLLDEDPKGAYPAIDRAFAQGWDDPRMADYDEVL